MRRNILMIGTICLTSTRILNTLKFTLCKKITSFHMGTGTLGLVIFSDVFTRVPALLDLYIYFKLHVRY